MTLFDDIPHHDGSAQYVGNDRPGLGDTVPIWLRVPHGYRLDGAWVRSTPDAEPHIDQAVVDRVDDAATWFRADQEIANPLTRYRWLLTRSSRPVRPFGGRRRPCPSTVGHFGPMGRPGGLP